MNEVNYNEKTLQAVKDITEADVWVIGTPIYNSMFSAALKNLFEFVNYKETAGKTAGLAILASGMIGFTDVQTLLTQQINLQEEIVKLNIDQDYIEKIAREKFMMVKPGEKVFRVIESKQMK